MRILLMLLLLPLGAHAAVRVNNGGGGWACRAGADVKWFRLADRFEMEAAGTKMLTFTGMDMRAIYEDRENEVRREYPELNAILDRHAVDVFSRLMPLPSAVGTSADARYFARPEAASCPGGEIEYLQVADYIQIGKLQLLHVDARIWNSALMTDADRAFLLWHERLYKAFREEFGDWHAGRTRLAGGILFSDQSVAEKRERLRTLLSMNEVSTGRAVQPGSGIRCTLFVYRPNDDEAGLQSWKDFRAGEERAMQWRGYHFQVRMGFEHPFAMSLEDGQTKERISYKDGQSKWVPGIGVTLDLGPAQMHCWDGVL